MGRWKIYDNKVDTETNVKLLTHTQTSNMALNNVKSWYENNVKLVDGDDGETHTHVLMQKQFKGHVTYKNENHTTPQTLVDYIMWFRLFFEEIDSLLSI